MEREVANARRCLRLDAAVAAGAGLVLVVLSGPIAGRFGAGAGAAAGIGAGLLVWALELGAAANAARHWLRSVAAIAAAVNVATIIGIVALLEVTHADRAGVALATVAVLLAGGTASALIDVVRQDDALATDRAHG
jgi:hypothetical protein